MGTAVQRIKNHLQLHRWFTLPDAAERKNGIAAQNDYAEFFRVINP